MSNTVSVVIPVYGQWSFTHQLISDIRQHWSPDEIIIVDDDSPDDDTMQGCAFWKKLGMPIRYWLNDENVGFLYSANIGMQIASCDTIVCMNNDVRIYGPKSWAYLLEEIKMGHIVGGTLINDGGWNRFGGKVFPYLEGWLLAASRGQWGDGFDTRYAISDFEDVDKSTEWLSNGETLVTLPVGSVVHLGAKSYGYTKERTERTERNRQKFAEKWGVA